MSIIASSTVTAHNIYIQYSTNLCCLLNFVVAAPCVCILVFLFADMLDDRHLLQLSKRIFSYWDELAMLLSVTEEEIGELMIDEGHSYHGAFRMLWGWRESSTDLQASVESLREALQQLGHSDVAQQVLRL